MCDRVAYPVTWNFLLPLPFSASATSAALAIEALRVSCTAAEHLAASVTNCFLRLLTASPPATPSTCTTFGGSGVCRRLDSLPQSHCLPDSRCLAASLSLADCPALAGWLPCSRWLTIHKSPCCDCVGAHAAVFQECAAPLSLPSPLSQLSLTTIAVVTAPRLLLGNHLSLQPINLAIHRGQPRQHRLQFVCPHVCHISRQ